MGDNTTMRNRDIRRAVNDAGCRYGNAPEYAEDRGGDFREVPGSAEPMTWQEQIECCVAERDGANAALIAAEARVAELEAKQAALVTCAADAAVDEANRHNLQMGVDDMIHDAVMQMADESGHEALNALLADERAKAEDNRAIAWQDARDATLDAAKTILERSDAPGWMMDRIRGEAADLEMEVAE